ncbi:uncharacterized protein LOC129568876 [Sitodiplosis mosellana]|uniref:uncharacterized protein LOC129568876 n=1 Tax=Sitodiplosis mosellana TaxID=263140 RepID=UPI0024437B96|nr:uncharacterized protein LOC129568876 [Sitodiplosis mosellana]
MMLDMKREMPLPQPGKTVSTQMIKNELHNLATTSANIKEMLDDSRPHERKCETKIHIVLTMANEFCAGTTIHGVRYFAEKKRHWIERVVPDLLTVQRNPNATHWNVEDGYNPNVNDSQLYPYRIFGVGFDGMIGINLDSYSDDFYEFCAEDAQGFRIALHSPDRFPRSSDFIHIPFNQVAFFSIKPNLISTSNGLRSYSPRERGCFFRAEPL